MHHCICRLSFPFLNCFCLKNWSFYFVFVKIAFGGRGVLYQVYLAYGGYARSTSGSQNLALLPKNDTIIAFFFGANKNKDNAKVVLTSSSS